MIRFGRYAVQRKIGQGGLADVFLGVLPEDEEQLGELEPGEAVALKVLRDPSAAPGVARRFLREGRMLQRLDHPGLPTCYEISEGPPRPYLALELLDGVALSDALRTRGSLAEQEVLALAESLLDTLAFLHARGVVHRDVKAGNVFLCSDGRVKLLDLGLARDPEEPGDVGVGDVLGTYAYMAPEQIAGAGSDQRADLYALGVTLFESLAGRRPYKARGPAGYLDAHTRGELPALPAGTSLRLADLVTKLMARDPSSRPQTATLARAILTGHRDFTRGLRRPPLAGRAAAMGALEALLEEGGFLQVVGEPGMGAGRLVREAWELAKGRGHRVFGLRCDGRGGAMAPLRRLRRALESEVGPLPGDPEALAIAVETLTRDGALTVVVERIDLSPARGRTSLIRVLQRPLVSVFCTGLHAAEGIPGHVVPLRALEVAEVGELIAGMLGTPRVPAGQDRRIHEFTGGLPGAVVFTLRDFYRRGVLRCEGRTDSGEPAWTMAPSARMTQDSGLAMIFRTRLDKLELDERRLLELLAVARNPLPERLSLQAAGIEDAELAPFRLEERHLATREGGWVGIRRPALAAVLLREAGPARVRKVHQALHLALGGRREPWAVERAAWHRAHGAAPSEAGRALVELSEFLEARGRSADALAVLLRASLGSELDARTAARAALIRGRAAMQIGRPREALDALAAASSLAEDQGLDIMAGSAGVARARALYRVGELTRAEEQCTSVLEGRDGVVAARALLLRARCRAQMGRMRQAGQDYRQVVDQALASGERELAALAHGGIGAIYAGAGRLGDALRHLRQEAGWLRREGSPQRLVRSLADLSELEVREGLLDRAWETAAEAGRVARSAENPFEVAFAGVARARVLVGAGDAAEALNELEGHWVAGSPEAPMRSRVEWLDTRIRCQLALGDRAAALAAANRVHDEAKAACWRGREAEYAGLVAVLRGQGRDVAHAVEELDGLGERRALARVLLEAGKLGDADILGAAVEEARAVGDAPLLLETLHAAGGSALQREAARLVTRMGRTCSGALSEVFQSRREVRWALGRRR